MKLDYLIIYQKSGLPIYSNCFSGFCANLRIDETLLSGFLSALSTMPDVLGDSTETIKSVDLQNIKLCFNHTTPSGHIMCLGIEQKYYSQKNEKQLNELFKKIDKFIETEYENFDFSLSTSDERTEFGNRVVNEIIIPSLGFVRKRCACGDTCEALSNDILIEIQDKYDSEKLHTMMTKPVWEKINSVYSDKPNFFKKIIFKFLIKLYMWKDNRIYERKMKKLSKRAPST